MNRPRRSISTRLLQINLLVSACALILASVAFLVYDAVSFRHSLVYSLRTEAQIIGDNSVSALLFDDRDAAHTTLSALDHAPTVLSAVIVRPNGERFATYASTASAPLPDTPAIPANAAHAEWTRGNTILLGSRIRTGAQDAGTVYILASTSGVWTRVHRYLMIAALVLLFSLALALVLTSSLGRRIADPIAGLVRTARKVSEEKDYSLRAPEVETGDEIAVLMLAFNQMIEQVQTRDRALSASRDLLEQRVQERTAELQAANKELESFSYSVAHDLRGPLDSLGNASYLLNQADLSSMDAHSQELLHTLPRTTERMSSLIEDLLNLSRSKSVQLHKEPLDLAQIARTILQDLADAAPDRRVETRLPEHCPATGDRGLMRVVLQNLLGNAWKYTSRTAHPCIEVGCNEQNGEVVFFVRDNGAGFDPRLKDRLFQPFERLHTEAEFSGTGIGLATVHRIIARHGGRIWAEGEPGKGATFYFTLASE